MVAGQGARVGAPRGSAGRGAPAAPETREHSPRLSLPWSESPTSGGCPKLGWGTRPGKPPPPRPTASRAPRRPCRPPSVNPPTTALVSARPRAVCRPSTAASLHWPASGQPPPTPPLPPLTCSSTSHALTHSSNQPPITHSHHPPQPPTHRFTNPSTCPPSPRYPRTLSCPPAHPHTTHPKIPPVGQPSTHPSVVHRPNHQPVGPPTRTHTQMSILRATLQPPTCPATPPASKPPPSPQPVGWHHLTSPSLRSSVRRFRGAGQLNSNKPASSRQALQPSWGRSTLEHSLPSIHVADPW